MAKKKTKGNLAAVIEAAKAHSGVISVRQATVETGLSEPQVYALAGTWKGVKGAPLWDVKKVSGHNFIVLTKEGKAWEANAEEVKTSEEDALAQLLEEMGQEEK